MWFNDRWPAGRFFAAWQQLAARYRSNPLVAGMDIMNEPRRSRVGRRILTPEWGSGRTTDLAAMYTMAGNLIHEVSPDVLIICEGPGYAADLAGVARHPVRLERPGKVVYSLHDYSWFHPREQARAAYLEQMHRAGGYLLSERIAPLWIGEFGIGTGSLAARGHRAGRGPAPVPLGRRRRVRSARPGLARCGESAGDGHPQDDDPAPHRPRRQLTNSRPRPGCGVSCR